MNDIIILRSVYGKVNQSYTLNPCVDRETGMLPAHVKSVDRSGDMILSNSDKESGKIFIAANEPIEVVDGTVFDLANPLQKAKWDAICHSALIAKERFAHDGEGNLLIDGSPRKYGRAVLYIERPGKDTQVRVNKTKLRTKAMNFIFDDTTTGMITKCKLLGKNMQHSYPADVQDYLLEFAQRNPNKIIDLYTGSDTEIRMLFIDAVNKGIVREKNGIFMYGDKINMGITDEATVIWLKQPENQKVVEYIKQETYPELYEKAREAAKAEASEAAKAVITKK